MVAHYGVWKVVANLVLNSWHRSIMFMPYFQAKACGDIYRSSLNRFILFK